MFESNIARIIHISFNKLVLKVLVEHNFLSNKHILLNTSKKNKMSVIYILCFQFIFGFSAENNSQQQFTFHLK